MKGVLEKRKKDIYLKYGGNPSPNTMFPDPEHSPKIFLTPQPTSQDARIERRTDTKNMNLLSHKPSVISSALVSLPAFAPGSPPQISCVLTIF